LGRKAQEVGELRKLSDSFLQAQINTNHQPPKQQNPQETSEPEVDFFEDPNLAVNKAIENHPKFKEFQEYQTQQVQTNAKTHLEQTHPDFTTVVADSKFQNWVKESPIRTQLFKAADEYNFDAANELLSTWKDRSMINKTQEVDAQSEVNRQAALKAGTTESRTSTDASGGGKQFRRADLIRMKIENPNQYESMQDEIYSAYAEGRVK
jgi:cysteinyl-tRNA synthetase